MYSRATFSSKEIILANKLSLLIREKSLMMKFFFNKIKNLNEYNFLTWMYRKNNPLSKLIIFAKIVTLSLLARPSMDIVQHVLGKKLSNF